MENQAQCYILEGAFITLARHGCLPAIGTKI